MAPPRFTRAIPTCMESRATSTAVRVGRATYTSGDQGPAEGVRRSRLDLALHVASTASVLPPPFRQFVTVPAGRSGADHDGGESTSRRAPKQPFLLLRVYMSGMIFDWKPKRNL